MSSVKSPMKMNLGTRLAWIRYNVFAWENWVWPATLGVAWLTCTMPFTPISGTIAVLTAGFSIIGFLLSFPYGFEEKYASPELYKDKFMYLMWFHPLRKFFRFLQSPHCSDRIDRETEHQVFKRLEKIQIRENSNGQYLFDPASKKTLAITGNTTPVMEDFVKLIKYADK